MFFLPFHLEQSKKFQFFRQFSKLWLQNEKMLVTCIFLIFTMFSTLLEILCFFESTWNELPADSFWREESKYLLFGNRLKFTYNFLYNQHKSIFKQDVFVKN